jgi:Spy/CpxP family protein refolding chaperone
MSKLLEKAISRVRELPEERQEALAELMLDFADQPDEWVLTEAQLAEVELAKQEVREGKIATKERMSEVWRRFRR